MPRKLGGEFLNFRVYYSCCNCVLMCPLDAFITNSIWVKFRILFVIALCCPQIFIEFSNGWWINIDLINEGLQLQTHKDCFYSLSCDSVVIVVPEYACKNVFKDQNLEAPHRVPFIKTVRCCLLSFQCERLEVYLVLTIITCDVMLQMFCQ